MQYIDHIKDFITSLQQKPESGCSEKPNDHAEWSEEDKERLENIIVFVSGYADKRVVKDWVNWLKSLRSRPKPSDSWKPRKEQMPVEKQDYSGLNDLERAIHRGFLCAGMENVPVTIIKETAQDCFTKMESAEWSEEDKRKLNRIYEILGYAADDKGFLKSKRIIGDKEAIELQDFLKSLRLQPHWKPSEIQMKYLDVAIAEADSHKSYNLAYGLEKLKDDLKKL